MRESYKPPLDELIAAVSTWQRKRLTHTGMGDINVAGQGDIDVAVFWWMDYIW